MATKIVTKNSSTASAVPTASDLVQGELAVNVADKRLFTEDNGGSIVELGTNPSSLTVTGEITANGGIALGDSDKATFGAGDDLQIYHDGSDSYIKDEGTGNLYLTTNGSTMNLQAGSDNMVKIYKDAQVEIFHDASVKLATTSTGIDVTGTATVGSLSLGDNQYIFLGDGNDGRIHFDGTDTLNITASNGSANTLNLTANNFKIGGASRLISGTANDSVVINEDSADVDFRVESDGNANMLFVDGGNNRVGVGTGSPNRDLHISGGASDIAFGITNSASGTSASDGFSITVENPTPDVAIRQRENANMKFLTNNTERMRIDSSGRVGIGTSTDTGKLNIYRSGGETQVKIRSDSNQSGNIYFTDATSGYSGSFSYNHTDNSMRFATNGTGEKMRIDSSGRVGIGTSSPLNQLVISEGTGQHGIEFAAGTTSYIQAYDRATSDYGDLKIDAQTIAFGTDNGAERMRISSAGLLMVSTSADFASGTVDGIIAQGTNKPAAAFSNTASGQIVKFYEGGSLVGSIGTEGGRLQIGKGASGLYFYDSGPSVLPWNIGSNAGADNSIDLGSSGARWDDIYATNGTIQTSDRNEKQDIAELSDAEQRVAVAAKGLLRKFRWKDSVAEKGDDARIHFGIIAQDLQAAFEAEGLDAGDYAMFISTTWTDEETNEEKTRMGVRYSELLAFIISAI